MISDDYYCFEEGNKYDYNEFKFLLTEELFKRNLIKKTGKLLVFKFTGFIFNKNYLIVVFPKGYFGTVKKESFQLKALLNALLRYKEEIGIHDGENELMGGMEGVHPEGFLAAINLLKDFLLHGYIRKQTFQHTINTGNNIDWQKTINRRNPVMSNNRPIYLDFVAKVKTNDRENLLYKLHRYAV